MSNLAVNSGGGSGGGGGTPGGVNGDLQYNNAGSFGGLTPGAGVFTALGVAVGSAGAFVVNGGALGTPSSGTLTNATGLPISTGVSGLGTGVATALAINTGTAGSVLLNGGLAAGQIAFGSSTSTVIGSAALTWTAGSTLLTVAGGGLFTGGAGSYGGSPAALVIDTNTAVNWQLVITDPGAADAYGIYSFSGGAFGFQSEDYLTTGTSLTFGPNGMLVESNARGAGAIAGKVLSAGRNTSGNGAAGALGLNNRSGTFRYVWQDNANALRVGAAMPLEDGSVSDTSGTLIALASWQLGQFSATTSAQLAGVISDETGSGALTFATAPTFPTSITIGAAGGATGTALFKGTTSGTVTLSVADAAGTWTMKLPTSAGTNTYLLQTDGSGNTSWVAPPAGGITIGTTTITSGSNTNILYNNSGVVGEYTVTGTGTVAALQTSPSFLTTTTLTRTAIGVTSTDGVIITNTTAAAAGAQQWSPRLRLTGQGWKTNATAASQTVDWIIENQPVQGAASPSTNLVMARQINAGGYTSALEVRSGSTTYELFLNNNGSAQTSIRSGGSGGNIIFNPQNIDGRYTLYLDYLGEVVVTSSGCYSWGNSSTTANGQDLILRRGAAAVLQIGNDVNGAAVSQTLQACNGITGTDKTGANLTIASGKGTGAGAVSSLIFQTPAVLGSGTTAQTSTTRMTIVEGSITVTTPTMIVASATSIPAGGTAGTGYRFSSTANFGVFFGSGAPSLAAAKGSLYLRSDGSGATDRAYINTDGSTTWTALTTVG